MGTEEGDPASGLSARSRPKTFTTSLFEEPLLALGDRAPPADKSDCGTAPGLTLWPQTVTDVSLALRPTPGRVVLHLGAPLELYGAPLRGPGPSAPRFLLRDPLLSPLATSGLKVDVSFNRLSSVSTARPKSGSRGTQATGRDLVPFPLDLEK